MTTNGMLSDLSTKSWEDVFAALVKIMETKGGAAIQKPGNEWQCYLVDESALVSENL